MGRFCPPKWILTGPTDDDDGYDYDDETVDNNDGDFDSDLQWGVAMAASTGEEWEQNTKRCKKDKCAKVCKIYEQVLISTKT